MIPSKPWDEVLQKSLEDPDTVLEYLKNALREKDEELVFIALENVMRARACSMEK